MASATKGNVHAELATWGMPAPFLLFLVSSDAVRTAPAWVMPLTGARARKAGLAVVVNSGR